MKIQMSRLANVMLIGLVATCFMFNGCGGSATAADGTVIAEFEWGRKASNHPRRNDARD